MRGTAVTPSERRTVADVVARWDARVRQLSLREAVGLLPYTTGAAAVTSIALVGLKVARLPEFPYFNLVVLLAGAAVIAGLGLALGFGRRPIPLPGWLEADAVKSWVLGLQIGVLLLVVPVLLLIKAVPEDDIPAWTWNFGYINKRWLIGLYNVAIVTFMVCPVAVERWRLRRLDSRAIPDRSPHKSRLRLISGAAVIVALAWYFTGPPWHLQRHHRPIDWHEQIHLGGLQAISKGYVPYIGPASSMYGPGSQILIYAAMRLADSFDIVSFRTAWAAVEFVTMVAWGLAAYWWLGLVGAVAGMLLAMTYSPLSFFYTLPDGTLAGYYGWANPLRYFPTLVAVVGFGFLATDQAMSRRSQAIGAAVLGGLWAAGAWLAQENLSASAAGAILLATLLCLTATVPVWRVLRLVWYIVVGFACVATPVVAMYAWHGTLGTFVRNYFLIPHAVAMGYSNLWWPPQDPVHPSYYFTLPFLIGLAICTMWRVPALRLVAPLDRSRMRFLAFICVQLVCYQTALFRSDAAHLMNTMIAMPFVLVLGVVDLPRWLAVTRPRRLAIAGLFIAVALALFPTLRSFDRWHYTLVSPMSRFTREPSMARPASGASTASLPVAFQRATPMLADEPLLASAAGISIHAFLDFANEIHDLVGARKTYIAWLDWRVWTGAIYFMADLTPAPYPLDRESMAVNGPLRTRIADHIRAHPEEYECFIGLSLDGPEAVAFLETHSGAVRFERTLPTGAPWGPTRVHVILSSTNSQTADSRSVTWR
jgi:hypothetical protein